MWPAGKKKKFSEYFMSDLEKFALIVFWMFVHITLNVFMQNYIINLF